MMPSTRPLRRWTSAGLSAAALVTAVALGTRHAPPEAPAAPARPGETRAWPMFGGTPHRNMANPHERGLPAEWEVEQEGHKPKNIKWSAALGSKAFGGPVIAGGRVFIGTNNQNPRDKQHVDANGRPVDLGVLMCFREADGQFLWQAVHRKLRSGRVNDWPLEGLPSMPAVDGDRLYYVSNRCELICADVETGRPVWVLDMIGPLRVFPHNLAICSPLVVCDLVFVVTANGVDAGHIEVPSPRAPSFLAVNKRTGKVAWQNNAPTARLLELKVEPAQQPEAVKALRNRGELLLHGQWSNPTYTVVDGTPQVIFPGGDGWLRAFEPESGRLLWQFDCNPKAAKWDMAGRAARSDFIATPAVHGGKLYIGTGQDPEHETGEGHLWCIDLAKATAKGRVNANHDVSPREDNFDPRAPVNRDSALHWHYGGPITDRQERRMLRRNNYFGRTLSTCAVHDGLCYAAELLGVLHCLDAETGQVYWSHTTDAPSWSSPFYADGKVYLGTDDGVVYVFAHGRQKKLLAENVMPDRVRGMPVALGGVLYVTSENRLYAIAGER